MLKLVKESIQTKENARILLKEMIKELNITDCKVGLAGSFAKGTQNEQSDLDIVLDFNDSYDIFNLEYAIHDYMKQHTDREYDIIYIGELLKEKNDLLEFGDTEESLGETFYDSIIKDVIWIA